MDIIDNILYASYVSPLQIPFRAQLPQPAQPLNTVNANNPNRIISDYLPAFLAPVIPTATGGSYALVDKMNFCSYEDTRVIESAVTRHWHDVDNQVTYDTNGISQFGTGPNGILLVSFENSSTYHLLTAYLLENTRLLQIFERFLEKYLTDEEFGITGNNQVISWIHNSEELFFRGDTQIRSFLRKNTEAVRRNAYWRMFGMDLAFGDINSQTNSSPYIKARTSNQQFIPLFEKYLSEVWQAYTNARNTSGENKSDINVLIELATQIRELLIARRGDIAAVSYANQNLSREEFAAMLVTSWFTFIISDDTPVVQFLNCQSSTIGERLIKIGNKVGVPAHSKCQSLFEMASAAGIILITVETGGVFDNPTTMQNILSSLNPNPPTTPNQVDADNMTRFLTLINNWEKATGHKIKNPEANITGTVRVQQNGVSRTQPAMN